jgi:hypothetical protein
MAVDKATAWQLSGPEPAQDVAIVATGLDGTTMPLVGEAYQEARCGTVALDDQEGERLTTAYLGALPEAFLWLETSVSRMESQEKCWSIRRRSSAWKTSYGELSTERQPNCAR